MPVLRATGGTNVPGYDSALLGLAPSPPSAPSDSAGLSTRQVALFVLTYLAYVAIYFARKPVSVTKVSLSEELGLTAEQLGAVDTAFLVTYTAGSFLGGRLGDLLGEL